MPYNTIVIFSGFLFLYIPSVAFAKQTVGWVEWAKLLPSDIELKAKLDTGAKNSSVNALRMEFFQQEGGEHVRFKVRNKAGKTVELSLPVVRRARIKRHSGKSQTRPVVRLTICIGSVSKEVEVNLVDRREFIYPLLIGRSYLAGDFLIDSATTNRLKSGCTSESER